MHNYYFRHLGNFGHLPRYCLPIFGANRFTTLQNLYHIVLESVAISKIFSFVLSLYESIGKSDISPPLVASSLTS